MEDMPMMSTADQDVWDVKSYLIHCAEIHPRAQIQDYMKRLYQSEFGSDRPVQSEEQDLQDLRAEIDNMTDKMKRRPWFDPFCSQFCRINLSVSKDISPELINRIYVNSCRTSNRLAWFRFEEKVRIFMELCREQPGLFRFTPEEVMEYCEQYKKAGYPVVSHSDIYIKAYEPAYRVVRKEYGQYISLYGAIEKALAEKEQVIVAIDGNCGAGKSTAARLIATLFDCNVFHCDSFFLPLEKRTPERMAEVGGNMERERLREEVLEPLRTGKPFSYRPFLCSSMELGDPVEVQPKKLNVVEGSYSMHPELREYYDITAFLTASPAQQVARILDRNGGFMLRRFIDEWIPKENAYFDQMKVREACQFIL